MADNPELRAAQAAHKLAFDHWVNVQQQTNDQRTIGAAKQGMDAAAQRMLALQSQAASPTPTAPAAADQLHPAADPNALRKQFLGF